MENCKEFKVQKKVWKILRFILLSLIFGYLPYCTFIRFLSPQKSRLRKAILFFGHILIMGMIIYVGDPVNILWTLPIYLLCVYLGAEGTPVARVSMAVIFFTISISVSAIIDNSFFLRAISNTLVRILFWIPIYLVVNHFVPKKEEIKLSQRLWLLLDGLAIAPFASIIIGITLTPETYSHEVLTPAVVMLPFALLSSISLLAALVVLAKQEHLEQESRLAQVNQSYYKQLEQHQQYVRRLRHDMANHLQAMIAIPPEEIQPYLNQLLEDPTFKTGKSFCENKVVNAVLSAKISQMEQEGMDFDIKVSLPKGLPFADTDLCSLFANSLDNAIEACRKLSSKSKTISISSRADKGVFILSVQNPYQEKPKVKSGILISSKDDSENHGFGTLTIKEIAKKYGGSSTFTANESEFELLMYLPLNN